MLKTETGTRLASPRFARFAWFVLAYNLAVILWGAFVRASGSGAGCGNHWPLCGGQLSPAFATLATVIEFLHRATSSIDGVLVIALAVWAFRAFPAGHPARLGGVLTTVFILTEGMIGAALVLLDQVAKNPSVARGYWLSSHLINTLTLLACLTLTAWWGSGRPAIRLRSPGMGTSAATLAAVMLLGVTGAIAALADTLFPAASLSAGLAQDFAPGANIFLHLRGLHPVLAAGVGTWLFIFAAGARRVDPRTARIVIGFTVAQLAAGLLNMLLLAPIWLQMVHLLIADGLWISLVWLCASKATAAAR
ncbi:MAG TPA: COX15/CtaA family protein [Candidatus Sulfopaludibacter sp.]|nr:COX15/CtaA family protein [Candidatus Sulfopaludibacter sp.]